MRHAYNAVGAIAYESKGAEMIAWRKLLPLKRY
ncbi:MAG: hypothetical protein ACI9MR_001413 [Myxococcota bacterium]|jgi:hypothetical protein